MEGLSKNSLLDEENVADDGDEEYDGNNEEEEDDSEEYLPGSRKRHSSGRNYTDENGVSRKGHRGNTNSPIEIVKAIIEAASNVGDDVKKNNRSKAFWEGVIGKKASKTIFEGFKSETLRKYWARVREISNIEKIPVLLESQKSYIEEESFKFIFN